MLQCCHFSWCYQMKEVFLFCFVLKQKSPAGRCPLVSGTIMRSGFFLVYVYWLRSKEWSLRYSPGRGNHVMHCSAVWGGGIREGTMLLTQPSAGFQSLPLLPTSKLGPSGADSQVRKAWTGRFFS